MFNIIRADLYRLSHGKVIYSTYALLFAGIAMGALFSEYPAPLVVTTQITLVIPFILAIIYAVCAPDFNTAAIKNALANGSPRTSLYAARLILSFLLSELLYLLGIAVNFAAELISPAPPEMAYVGSSATLLTSIATQSFMILAMVATGCAIIFISRRGVVCIAVFLALFFGVSIALSIISFAGVEWIVSYDFTYTMGRFAAQFGDLEQAELIRGLALGAFYLLASTALGVVLFRRSEIK
ncbi:MAG: hypothetical protein LBS98_03365 [Coriobacteriales bacterium]|jgi:hypothetical protein|nr:hypothetical protein [Coriobacteriales bacterium]